MIRTFTVLVIFFLVKDSVCQSLPFDRCKALKPMSHQEAQITNRRYMNEDNIYGRPKGIYYGDLPGAGDEQKPVLFPDGSSTYNVANISIPSGASMELRGTFPHVRYFSITITNQLADNRMGNGPFYRADDIVPDAGSQNPYLPSVGREVPDRNYTMYIIPGFPPPGPPPDNTIFTGNSTKDNRIRITIRHYLADQGYMGSGYLKLNERGEAPYFGLPTVILNLADGTSVDDPVELVKMLNTSKNADLKGYHRNAWLEQVKNAIDSTNAPCIPDPSNGFQVFWDTDYSITGLFISSEGTEEERVAAYPPTGEGGFSNNPDTRYLTLGFSFGFNEVLVVQGKMPSHPNTRRNEPVLPVDPQVQYFSVNTAGVAPSGEGWMTVFDEGIPVDEEGNYMVVVSWPWNRPTNAIPENGVTWLDPGVGEGHFIGARNWVGSVYIRFQGISTNWTQSPLHIPMPTAENPIPQDANVMGDYFPRASYTSKHDFEKKGTFGKCAFS